MFGPGGRRGPNMYGRGDLKYVLLELLKEQPKHGYEMIKDLEGRAGGFYTPSAGAVYPTLQLMEDRGWVTSATVEGKKVYTITDTGRAALEERSAQEQPFGPGHEHHHRHGPRGPFGPNAGPELGALGRESIEVARLMRDAVMTSNGDPVRLTQLRTIMEQTQAALRAFLQQGAPTPNEPPAEKPPEMV
jgi:DNA-binding PadR family transcriptional regulator